MAGIGNSITFSQGHKLQPSTAQDILNMQKTPNDVSIINFTGDPEGSISANPGSLCHDPVAGILYLKSTGTSNTGWAQIGTAGGGMSFIDQGSSTTVSSDTGYFVTGNFAMTLPASPSQGDTVVIIVDTTSVVTVTANTGQIIRLGSSVTATAGSIASTARGDVVRLVYRASSAAWISESSIGNWTF